MKKSLIIGIILCLTSIIYQAHAQEVKHLTTEEFKKEIWDYKANKEWKYQGNKPAIVDLYATWCPPCQKLSPILEQIQKGYGKKIRIYKVDVDKSRELAQVFNANSIPMMIFIPTNGKPFTVVGFRSQEQLEQIISEKLNLKK
ncbi:MAG: thioredoxin family protein [Odoribacter sp.]|nr:thioredoxin family protein [Odoribacter sp.]